jgi:uncharacterized protein YegL
MLTEIVFILDRSGSMSGMEKDTIGGFNSMLKKQKKEKGDALVSTVLFDDKTEVIHDRVPIEDVPKLTKKQYYVRGCTALLDAVGGAIHHIENIHKYARRKDVPDKTLFVITTDGYENASSKYTYKQVKQKIEKKKKKKGWEFIFLGANIDAIGEAEKLGIERDMATNFVCDDVGIEKNFEGVSCALSSIRCGRPSATSGWKDEIEADFESRG